MLYTKKCRKVCKNIFQKKNMLNNPFIKRFKNPDRLYLWLINNNFFVNKFANSDLSNFLNSCPLSKTKKHLMVHSLGSKKNEIILFLKEHFKTTCFKLIRLDDGFMIKKTDDLAWIFDSKGKFINRTEHKKVKIWLGKFNLPYSYENKNDLQKSLEKCPECEYEKLLRFRRSYSENILDLQCKCKKNFRVKFNRITENTNGSSFFEFMYAGKVLKTFDINGMTIKNK